MGKSFQDLWKQGKLMLGKMNKNGASKINIEKLTKATKVKAEPKALPKPAPKAKAPKAKAPKAPTAKPVVKPKKAAPNPMGTSYYASRNAKAAKVETGEEIKKRLAVTMKKYKKPVVADDAAKVADDVVKQADDVVKKADDVAAAATPKKDV